MTDIVHKKRWLNVYRRNCAASRVRLLEGTLVTSPTIASHRIHADAPAHSGKLAWNKLYNRPPLMFLRFVWVQQLDVGQNGRPLMGPQMLVMSSLVLTIHNLIGVPNFEPYPVQLLKPYIPRGVMFWPWTVPKAIQPRDWFNVENCDQVLRRIDSRGIPSPVPWLPSGKHTKSYWKWPFIVFFPIKHGDFP